MIFAKNEVRVTVFDDGNRGKDLPTGFSAEVEGMKIIKTILYLLFDRKILANGFPFAKTPSLKLEVEH